MVLGKRFHISRIDSQCFTLEPYWGNSELTRRKLRYGSRESGVSLVRRDYAIVNSRCSKVDIFAISCEFLLLYLSSSLHFMEFLWPSHQTSNGLFNKAPDLPSKKEKLLSEDLWNWVTLKTTYVDVLWIWFTLLVGWVFFRQNEACENHISEFFH